MSDQPASLAPSALLDTAPKERVYNIPQACDAIRAAGRSPAGCFFEWLKLRLGKNSLAPGDYLGMKLWDRALYPEARLETFIGKDQKALQTWNKANFIPELQALASSKLAADGILSAHGLPVAPVLGFHAAQILPGNGRTTTPEQLESFLLHDLVYPAFGKPLWGIQSLGSVSLESRDAAAGTVTLQGGRTVKAADLAREIHAAYMFEGYVFQPRLKPHPDVRAVCGDRVASVRVVTIMSAKHGPCVFRTCWKIPGGASTADNFWRGGNILAGIDMESRTVKRALTGAGAKLRAVETHPDTGARLIGLKVPLWQEICTAALFGAAALSGFGLLGWDVAATEDGPVILDVNERPDLTMNQMADGQGAIDETFGEFLAERAAARKAWKKSTRDALRRNMKIVYEFSRPKE